MAQPFYRVADGVVEFGAGNIDEIVATDVPFPVVSIIVTSPSATTGIFSVKLGNTVFDITTSADYLTVQTFIRMACKTLEVTALPTGGKVWVLLDQMP